MNTNTLIIAAGLGLLWLYARRGGDASKPKARIGTLGEEGIIDGTNWTSDLWSTLQTAADFRDPTAPNIAGTANADPGVVGQAQIGVTPGWDGSL